MLKRRAEAFFGRRCGRPLRAQQERLYSQLLPSLALPIQTAAPVPVEKLFSQPVSAARLEIGFGGGEHLLHETRRCPDTGFIGVEPFINGMAKLLAQVAEDPSLLPRLRLYNEDATQVLDWLPPASLTGIDLFYPDPWPKKKHWKRRFVSQTNLVRFARVLKPGGLFRFASDIESYVNWTLQLFAASPDFSWQAKSAQDWTTPFAGWTSTRYEKKALLAGRRPTYLTFRRL